MDISKNSDCLEDYEWAVVLNRACLRLLGVWPSNDGAVRKILADARVCLILTVIFSCIVPSLHSLVRVRSDFLSMIDNLQYTLPSLITMLKGFILWRKRTKLAPLLDMIKADWLKRKTDSERRIMMKCARIARILTICGYLLILVLFFFAVILPTCGFTMRYVTNQTDSDKLLIMQTYYVYDVYNSPVYEMTIVLQCFCIMSTGAMFTSTDLFMGLLIFHVCGQLEILKARILRLGRSDFIGTLSRNIRDHERLIRSIENIDDTFTLTLFAQLIYFGFLFILQGFLFVTIMSQSYDISVGRIIFTILIFIGTFTHMCLYCILGEILLIQCDGVYEAVCEYEWYKLQPKQARCLILIMIRANKPLYLTAGKLFPMTMSTLCKLLKTSGGYISVLLAYRD